MKEVPRCPPGRIWSHDESRCKTEEEAGLIVEEQGGLGSDGDNTSDQCALYGLCDDDDDEDGAGDFWGDADTDSATDASTDADTMTDVEEFLPAERELGIADRTDVFSGPVVGPPVKAQLAITSQGLAVRGERDGRVTAETLLVGKPVEGLPSQQERIDGGVEVDLAPTRWVMLMTLRLEQGPCTTRALLSPSQVTQVQFQEGGCAQ